MESHGEDLRGLANDDALVAAVKKDYRSADLSPRQLALCDLAVAATENAHGFTAARMREFGARGLSDGDLHDAVQVTALFNYFNILVDSLGADLEDWMIEGK